MRPGNIIVLLLLSIVIICGPSIAHMRDANLSDMTGALAKAGSWAHLSIPDASDNLCAAFGWRGYVDTDLKFSEFFSRNHTIAARFMIQYPRSYQAPILSLNGEGDYTVAIAKYGGVK